MFHPLRLRRRVMLTPSNCGGVQNAAMYADYMPMDWMPRHLGHLWTQARITMTFPLLARPNGGSEARSARTMRQSGSCVFHHVSRTSYCWAFVANSAAKAIGRDSNRFAPVAGSAPKETAARGPPFIMETECRVRRSCGGESLPIRSALRQAAAACQVRERAARCRSSCCLRCRGHGRCPLGVRW